MCWLQPSAQLWSYPTFLLLPLIVIACIECFAGYRAWRFLIGVNGAILGMIAGTLLSMLLGAPLLIFFGGVAGAILFATIVPVGTFIFAFASAASLTILLAHCIGVPPNWIMFLAVTAGLASAVAALCLCRPFMIAIAAVAGAQQIASSWRVYHLPFGSPPLPDNLAPSECAAFLALAALGLLIQFATSPARPPKTAKAKPLVDAESACAVC